MKIENLVSFHTVCRDNWQIKASIYKDSQVLFVANNIVNNACVIRVFDKPFEKASEFINFLIDKDNV